MIATRFRRSPHRSGCPGITGKDPAVIAVGVAAALIPLLDRQRRPPRKPQSQPIS